MANPSFFCEFLVLSFEASSGGVFASLAAACSSICGKRWLLISPLVACRNKFKPLSERIAQGLWQGVYVSQDDVEGEGELIHVGADLWQFCGPFEYGHLDVQDGILQHSTRVQIKSCVY